MPMKFIDLMSMLIRRKLTLVIRHDQGAVYNGQVMGVDVRLLSSISNRLAVIWLLRCSKSGFLPFFAHFENLLMAEAIWPKTAMCRANYPIILLTR
eukprot:sb/3479149/